MIQECGGTREPVNATDGNVVIATMKSIARFQEKSTSCKGFRESALKSARLLPEL